MRTESKNRGIGELGKKHVLAICYFLFAVSFLLPLFGGCQQAHETVLVGRPEGPYRLELALSPPQPQAGQKTSLTYRLTDNTTREPVANLQILHERIIHTFIVSQDFRSFAHTHHEDFFPLTSQDIAAAQFHFPYTFPQAGTYLIASEFTHKDRSWVKQFTVPVVGSNEEVPGELIADLARTKTFGHYQVSLSTSPAPPVVGHDAELVLHLTREGVPVSDIGIYLGTEVHMATWRLDGAHFGHQHTYTPAMAKMMAMMSDHASNPQHMAKMMVQLMRGPARQVYWGPTLPVHHVFPAPGVYKIFFECAPGGKPIVLDFMVAVEDYSEGKDTTVHSIVSPPVVTEDTLS